MGPKVSLGTVSPCVNALWTTCVAIATGLAGSGCRANTPTPAERQTVEVSLPSHGVVVGDTLAPLAIVEFGSYTCPSCERFHRKLFPTMAEKYLAPGIASYRYVDVSPTEGARKASLLAECLAEVSDFESARTWVFESRRFGSYDDARDSATLSVPVKEVSRFEQCLAAPERDARRRAERVAAQSLGVVGTPTFLIGRRWAEGRYVGWALIGLPYAETLDRWVGEAYEVVSGEVAHADQ